MNSPWLRERAHDMGNGIGSLHIIRPVVDSSVMDRVACQCRGATNTRTLVKRLAVATEA